MITAEDITLLNERNALIIADSNTPFDAAAADLVMRNIAVATDRLSAGRFTHMSTEAQNSVYDAANVASKLAPMADGDMTRLPEEFDADYGYRTTVSGPLFSLQAALNHGKFNQLSSDSEARDLRLAALLASDAFTMLISETVKYPEINQTLPYFLNNSLAAEKRLKPLQDR